MTHFAQVMCIGDEKMKKRKLDLGLQTCFFVPVRCVIVVSRPSDLDCMMSYVPTAERTGDAHMCSQMHILYST